jgi:hypothetical protein
MEGLAERVVVVLIEDLIEWILKEDSKDGAEDRKRLWPIFTFSIEEGKIDT